MATPRVFTGDQLAKKVFRISMGGIALEIFFCVMIISF
jgi:hypothetical protein